MGLFSRHAEPAPQRQPVYEEPPAKQGLFSRRAEPVPQHQPAYEEPPVKHGLFSRHAEPAPQQQPVYDEPARKHGLFGSRHHSPSRATSTATRSTRSSVSTTSPDRAGGQRSGLLHRSFGNGNSDDMDPSIVQARERVLGAENAEREADRALVAARESTRLAREHVRMVELEAQEDARKAKLKAKYAQEVSKRGKQLGRKWPRCHDPLPQVLTRSGHDY